MNIEQNIIKSIAFYFRNAYRNEIDSFLLKVKSSSPLMVKEDKASSVYEVLLENQHEYDYEDIRFKIIDRKSTEDIIHLSEPEKSERIIEFIKNKEQAAFDYIYEYELPKTVVYITRNYGSVQNAEDIFQDAFMIVYEKICSNNLKIKSSVSAYLYTVSKNLWNKQLKTRNLNVVFIDDMTHDEIDASTLKDINIPDNYESIAQVIDSLSDSCKTLLECYYYRKMSWAEIAKYLGYSNAGSARNQKYKCVERIKSRIKAE